MQTQSFIPPVFTKFVEHLTSVILSFIAIVIIGYICAMVFSQAFGKSAGARQIIFSLVSFAVLVIAGYVAITHLKP